MPTAARRSPLPILAGPSVAAIVASGVWVAGGVISDDYRTSMALTALWFGVSGAVCVLVARRRPAIRVPVIAAYLLTAGVIGAYLAATTLRDEVVHERVITAAPAPAAVSSGTAAPPEPGPVELARGRFRPHEHATAGTARVIRDTDGRRYLTLTSFSTSPGPDLRVRLVPAGTTDGGDAAVDVGALKGNRGDQQYRIPRGVDLGGRAVVIWCRAFSAPFGSAVLKPV